MSHICRQCERELSQAICVDKDYFVHPNGQLTLYVEYRCNVCGAISDFYENPSEDDFAGNKTALFDENADGCDFELQGDISSSEQSLARFEMIHGDALKVLDNYIKPEEK